jgi:hypothetical protein
MSGGWSTRGRDFDGKSTWKTWSVYENNIETGYEEVGRDRLDWFLEAPGGSSEHGDETTDSIRGGEYLDQKSDC